MASSIRFFRNKDKNENIEYKNATAYSESVDHVEFKFFELTRTDINRKEEIKLHMDSASKVICTSNESIEFNNDFIIYIDGERYHVSSIYIELDEDTNNFFHIKARKRTYLTLERDV